MTPGFALIVGLIGGLLLMPWVLGQVKTMTGVAILVISDIALVSMMRHTPVFGTFILGEIISIVVVAIIWLFKS